MRVVSDGSSAPQMRRTDDAAGTLPASTTPAALPAPAKQGVPILGAALFVIACGIGGVVVAIVRPLGLG